jgi:hypothetical protein
MLAQKSGIKPVVGPNNILDTIDSKLGSALLLLNIIEVDSGGGDNKKVTSASEVDVGSASWRLEGPRRTVRKIFNVNSLIGGVEDGKSISGDENGRASSTTFGFSRLDTTGSIFGKVNQFV